ncbi:hypothetical protein DFH07DRAFT_783853 [Mycena maculata]|uniref:Uncharacterized protein n=1 Tax=Mycena maculata TaxID=230809 RepID=A0AAD7HKS5_9AGAR|nr:hypothetical protein DFH07DRAFT_783853 [Mycena maculata]
MSGNGRIQFKRQQTDRIKGGGRGIQQWPPPPGQRDLKEEEDQRQKDNAVVALLQAQVVARPHDKEVLLKCLHLKEDYEDKYGTYIRDKDVESALAQQDSALDSLLQRCQIIVNAPLWDTETIWDYVHDRDAFEEKYKTSTDIDNKFRQDVNLKCASLLYYEELIVVRGWLKSFRRNNFEPTWMVPTLERPTWNFLLPNPYLECTDARLEYHCNCQVYHDFIETKVKSARELASHGTSPPATISLAIFYTTFDFLFEYVMKYHIFDPDCLNEKFAWLLCTDGDGGNVATVHKSPLLWANPFRVRAAELRCWLHAHSSDRENCGQFWPKWPRLAIARHARLAAEMAEMERCHVRAFLLSIAEAATHYSLADLEWALEFAFREHLRRRCIH